MNIPTILDTLGKNLSRIKTIGTVIILVLLIISLTRNGYNKSELSNVVKTITGLELDITKKDSVLIAKDDSIRILKGEIEQSEYNESVLNSKYDHIKGKYDDISGVLIKLSSDESYEFLNDVAYPYEGVKKYPFNEPQVKGIHKTYLENESLIALNDNLQEQKEELTHQVQLHNALTFESESSMAIMKETRKDLEQIIENKDVIIEINEKDAKKAKRKSFFRNIGIGAGIGALIILIIT